MRKFSVRSLLYRLKSPVVLMQILTYLGGLVIYFLPDTTEVVDYATAAIVAAVSLFSGLNNPCDRDRF